MKIVKRPYLVTLIRVMGTPEIKVITGVRRSGKSTLLHSFMEYVAAAITDVNIIHVDFNSLDFEFLAEYHALHQYIEEHYLPGRRNFVFIDEVQMCQGFEKAVNSLHNSSKYDIYITGSNAFLLSSDLATLFTGRVFPIEIFPFSFREYMRYYSNFGDQYMALDNYIEDGGLAGAYIYNDLPEKYRYVEGIYDTLIMRDIQQKYRIQNIPVLHKVSDFLLDNVSRLTTSRNITNTLVSDHVETNHKTVGVYLSYLCDAYAFYKVKRFDIQGKDYLHSQDKYYLVDHSIKAAKLGTKNANHGSIYENMVAIELLRRGFEIYVGTLGSKEVDFVAKKGDRKLYIQVAYDIDDPDTFQREVTPLLAIRDAYPKLIIARTREGERQYEGIRILDIADWLLEK